LKWVNKKINLFKIADRFLHSITVLLGSPTLWSLLYNCPFTWERDVGLGFESCEHEILSQVLTGLARARDVLPKEVTRPRTFEIINFICSRTTHLYTDHSSQLGGLTYSLN
jgi:hypothetical protein